jgi:ribulose 1,5-bisphosphate synthetase/thiazole synthase
MTRTLGRAVPGVATCQDPVDWDREADVVAIGAGATGLPAAIVACEAGCSVILVEAENDVGGHAIPGPPIP